MGCGCFLGEEEDPFCAPSPPDVSSLVEVGWRRRRRLEEEYLDLRGPKHGPPPGAVTFSAFGFPSTS